MKTLVITGASKGIGLSTAVRFANAGYRVLNISRTEAPDARIENHAIDLSMSDCGEQLTELLAFVLDDGEICLVHNAARMVRDRAGETDPDALAEILAINVMRTESLEWPSHPKMAPGSSLIYIGSTLGEKAVAGTHSYVVSKHAIVGMMRATCQDLAGRGIHTACICPGFTDTETLRARIGEDESVLESFASNSAYGGLIEPEDIAATIDFAANNPVINGAVIHANLGQIEHSGR
ncbi:MAG: SDR family oxidoreductase [Gammaproteobacteria bacterium]|nr:SDR family oxidoreductase [Gammaproteobacteria bacterium]